MTIEGLEKPAMVHKGGMTVTGNDGKMVSKMLVLIKVDSEDSVTLIITEAIFNFRHTFFCTTCHFAILK